MLTLESVFRVTKLMKLCLFFDGEQCLLINGNFTFLEIFISPSNLTLTGK